MEADTHVMPAGSQLDAHRQEHRLAFGNRGAVDEHGGRKGQPGELDGDRLVGVDGAVVPPVEVVQGLNGCDCGNGRRNIKGQAIFPQIRELRRV